MILLQHRSPTTIPWFIVAVIVHAVDRRTGRFFSHVEQKVPEVAPPVADGDPTAAPVFEPFIFWVVTAGKHTCPTVIRRRDSIRRVPVPIVGIRFTLLDAATRARDPGADNLTLEGFLVS